MKPHPYVSTTLEDALRDQEAPAVADPRYVAVQAEHPEVHLNTMHFAPYPRCTEAALRAAVARMCKLDAMGILHRIP